jgi:integrase
MNHRGDGQVYKRGDTYWICYWHRGRRYRESAKTDNERAARKLLRDRLTDFGRGKTAAIVSSKVTFGQMAESYLNDYATNKRRSLVSARNNVEHLRQFFGDDLAIDIKTPTIRQFIKAMQDKGYSNASINRYLAALRRMFSLMIEDEVLEAAPHFPMLEEDNVRQGTIEPGDFERLLVALPAYLKNPVEFLYRSAWRIGEMRTLQWKSVNLTANELRLIPEHSKNKKAREVALRGKLLEVIERAHRERRLDCPFVFHHDGEPIGDFRKSWRNACKVAGIQKLLFHDLRRSGITNMRRAGIPETVAMKISGHKTTNTFRRYQIEGTRDMEQELDRLDTYLDEQAGKSKVVPLRSAS